MSKAINQVLNYANEDEVSIYKHWIVFVRVAISSIITATVLFFVTFMIARTRFSVRGGMILLMLIITGYRFFKAYSTYKSTVLTINNIRLYGETGLLDVGAMNAPIENVATASYSQSFFGKQFGFGSVQIILDNGSFIMDDMVNVEAFCEAVILMREAYLEAARIRQDERNDKSRQDAAKLQAELDHNSRMEVQKLASEQQEQLVTKLAEMILQQGNTGQKIEEAPKKIEETPQIEEMTGSE